MIFIFFFFFFLMTMLLAAKWQRQEIAIVLSVLACDCISKNCISSKGAITAKIFCLSNYVHVYQRIKEVCLPKSTKCNSG